MIEGLRVLVTGGSTGIGSAICRTLAAGGARVAVADIRNPNDATGNESDPRGLEYLWIPADLTVVSDCRDAVATAAREMGGLDVLVNNVGGPLDHVPFESVTEQLYDDVLNLNLKSAFFVSQAVAPHLRASGRGRIVNLASELFFLGNPSMVPYVAAKGGIIGLTRSLALALAPSVTVNAVAPGPTATERLMQESWFKERGAEELARVPLARWGDPDDVAQAVRFLVGGSGNWITGEILNVNGGIVMS